MLSKIYGTIAFICLILAPGAAEGGMWITTFVLILAFAFFARLAADEDGQLRDRNRRKKPRHHGR